MQEIKEFTGDKEAIKEALKFLFGEGWESLPKAIKTKELSQERANFINPNRGMRVGKMVEILSRINAFRCTIKIPVQQKES